MGKKRKTKKKNNPLGGLGKLASFTSESIGSAYDSYKKRQHIKKIEEIKLKKLEESHKIKEERKELKLKEDQVKKDQEKLRIKEEKQKI